MQKSLYSAGGLQHLWIMTVGPGEALDVVGLSLEPRVFETSRGHWGQCHWTGRHGWWFPSSEKINEGCVLITERCHSSLELFDSDLPGLMIQDNTLNQVQQIQG